MEKTKLRMTKVLMFLSAIILTAFAAFLIKNNAEYIEWYGAIIIGFSIVVITLSIIYLIVLKIKELKVTGSKRKLIAKEKQIEVCEKLNVEMEKTPTVILYSIALIFSIAISFQINSDVYSSKIDYNLGVAIITIFLAVICFIFVQIYKTLKRNEKQEKTINKGIIGEKIRNFIGTSFVYLIFGSILFNLLQWINKNEVPSKIMAFNLMTWDWIIGVLSDYRFWIFIAVIILFNKLDKIEKAIRESKD